MGTLIVVGVIVLVLLVFVGLVWLFVRISGPPQPRLPEPAQTGKTRAQSGKAAEKPKAGQKAKGKQSGTPHR